MPTRRVLFSVVTLGVAFAMGIVWGVAAPVAQAQAGCETTTVNEQSSPYDVLDCDKEEQCPFGNCDYLMQSITAPTCPNLGDTYRTTISLTPCDTDIYQIQAALYDSSQRGYMTGGALTYNWLTGLWTATFCTSNAPTDIQFYYQGLPGYNYWTNGIQAISVQVCCSSCEPED